MSALKATLLRSAAALLSACFLAVPAWAQHGGGCACGHHQNAHPTWEIDLATPELQNAATAQLTKWNSVVDVWDWSIGDGTSGINGKNEIAFLTSSQVYTLYGLYTGSGTLGIAFLSPLSSFGQPSFNSCPMPAGTTCGTFAETDALLISDFYEGWTTDPPGFGEFGPRSFGAVALHELGHTLGLHHNFANLSTMNYVDDSVGIYLSAADAAIARQHYPADAQTLTDIAAYPFRYSLSTFSAPAVVASPSPSFVAPGSPFTLRSFSVENPGSVALANVTLSVYLSTDKTVTAGDVLIGTLAWPSFSPGGWWDTSGWSFTVPAATPPGDYYIGAIVTYDGSASDGVTYNNSWVLDDARRLKVTPTHTLTVIKAGAGEGSVKSSPSGGIDCGADCSEVYPEGAMVILTPKPEEGFVFSGWSGACTGAGACVVTMDGARSVTATFSNSFHTCLPVDTLSCNGSDSWANYLGGSTNSTSNYGCPYTYSYYGPEYTYTFEPPSDSRVKLTLTSNNSDLDVLVLGETGSGCEAGACIASSVYAGSSRINRFAARAGDRYHIVVDGRYGATGNYTLQVTCTGPTFADVPVTYWADPYIEALYNARVTTGCAESPKRFCPEETVGRDQMAVFLERALKGANFTPLAASGVFSDVPAGHWAGGWIEQLYQEGITGGCASNPLRYCPDAKITRAEMAVFLLRAKYGPTYKPYRAWGDFEDVPTDHWAADWIEALYGLGITTGCAENRFCPDAHVTRAQMAVFLQRTFNLPLP
ncbi:MAG TPA: S-layer homology domain-containing protein [Thermoanaerobaculia bacterium]